MYVFSRGWKGTGRWTTTNIFVQLKCIFKYMFYIIINITVSDNLIKTWISNLTKIKSSIFLTSCELNNVYRVRSSWLRIFSTKYFFNVDINKLNRWFIDRYQINYLKEDFENHRKYSIRAILTSIYKSFVNNKFYQIN